MLRIWSHRDVFQNFFETWPQLLSGQVMLKDMMRVPLAWFWVVVKKLMLNYHNSETILFVT